MGSIMRDAAIKVGAMFAGAWKTVVRHWPQLLTLYFIGAALRGAFIWLAVVVSQKSALVAQCIVPLAPISTLMSLVLMLRVCGLSLPAFTSQKGDPTTNLRKDLSVAVKVLVPFLAVYATQGMLIEDIQQYMVDTLNTEVATYDILQTNFGRAGLFTENPWMVLGLVVVVIVLRKILTLTNLTKKHTGWLALSGYLEALWLVTLATYVAKELQTVVEWVQTRVAVVGFLEWGRYVLAQPWATVFRMLINLGIEFVNALDILIVLPLAWLAVGATVFGASFEQDVDAPGTQRKASPARRQRIPTPVRRVATQLAQPVVTPVQSVVNSLRHVATAGILPMTMFALIFVLANSVDLVVAWLFRVVVGPIPQLDVRPLALSYFRLFSHAVYFLITLPLVASAINTVVLARRETEKPGVACPGTTDDAHAIPDRWSSATVPATI